MHTTSPALIIGGGSGNGLSIARNLGSQGIPVYCVTSNPQEITCSSKYCVGSAIIPAVERDPPTLQRVLATFPLHPADRGVLFPTTDTALLTVAQLRPQLDRWVTYLPRKELVETMVMKSRFYRSLQQWDVPHPRTLLLDPDAATVEERELWYPIYIRPVQSLPFRQYFRRKGFVAQNARELQAYLRRIRQHRLEVMLQEIIPGPTRNLYHLRGYISRDGQPLILLASHKLRQPTMFSDNTALVSIPLTELSEGVSIIRHYFHHIRYTGLFGADFKRDPRDGQLKLLEINARSQGGNYFGVVCHANHVLAAYQDSLGEPVQPLLQYRVGVYYADLVMDLLTFLHLLVQGRVTREDVTPFLRHPHWNYFSRQDLKPFLQRTWGMVRHTRD